MKPDQKMEDPLIKQITQILVSDRIAAMPALENNLRNLCNLRILNSVLE